MRPITSLAKYALGMVLAASAFTSCTKDKQTEQSQPIVSGTGYGNLSYYASTLGATKKTGSTQLKTNASSDTEVVVEWASATLYVEKILFAGQGKGLVDTTITIEKNLNIFNANALAGAIQLPAGSYKNVKLKLFCRKSLKSELAFNFRGTFTNINGSKDSIVVGSSFPFEADVTVADIVINTADKYKATFSFDLSKVLKGISTRLLEINARPFTPANGKKGYIIWKGGSADEPFYDQVIANWQSVASVAVSKE